MTPPGGGKSTPRAELQADYSAIEEAKADIPTAERLVGLARR